MMNVLMSLSLRFNSTFPTKIRRTVHIIPMSPYHATVYTYIYTLKFYKFDSFWCI